MLIAHANAAEFQRTPPSNAEEVRHVEVIHKAYKGHVRLARSLLYVTAPTEETYPITKTLRISNMQRRCATVLPWTCNSVGNPRLGLIALPAVNGRNATMLKDIKQYDIWLLCNHDDHILLNSNIMGEGGLGGGTVGPCKPNIMEVVTWSLPHGDTTHVKLMSGGEDAKSTAKATPNAVTLYTFA